MADQSIVMIYESMAKTQNGGWSLELTIHSSRGRIHTTNLGKTCGYRNRDERDQNPLLTPAYRIQPSRGQRPLSDHERGREMVATYPPNQRDRAAVD